MRIRINSLICIIALYATVALTLPYEWRVGAIAGLCSNMVASGLVIIVYCLCKMRSKMMFWYVIYNFILLFSTYLNDIPIEEQLELSLMGISLAGSFELINRYGNKRLFKVYLVYLVFLVVFNALQTIYYGGTGGPSEYFCIFGNKNWYLYKILPAIFLMLFWCARYRKGIMSIKFNIVYILALISVMIASSGAGTFVLGLWALYIILIPLIKRIKQNQGFDNYIVYTSIIILVFFIIVIWNAAEIFAPIIVDLLGKDLTFTTRTRIWSRALELIAQKPIFGYGALETENIVSLFYGIPDFTTTHNQYLGELFRGGVVLLGVFVMMVISSFRKVKRAKNINISKAMTFGLFCLLLWWMMESITSMYLVLVLFICYHLPESEEY